MSPVRNALASLAGMLMGLSAAAAGTAAPARAQDKPAVSPVIARLLPSTGRIRGGQFTLAAEMGMGNGESDLAFDHPCLKSDPLPARSTIALTSYGGAEGQAMDLAKSAVAEVFGKLVKTDFSKAK